MDSMARYDPDIVRWDLHHLIDGCSITNAGSLGSITQYGPEVGHVEYVQAGYVEPEQVNVENDEVIAHAFQEELSRLALHEESEVSASGNEQLQASVLSQNWLGPSEPYQSDDGNVEGSINIMSQKGEKTTDGNARNPAACSSPGGNSGSEEDDVLHTLDIEDESALDGEVGKRLHHMVPVPHVPRINGEIPSVDEELSDHQRLLDRLLLYDLVENKVQGDGNCQFRALSDQLYRSPEHHRFVRQQIVEQLKSHPELYDGYVPMSYGDYIKKMIKNGEWGDHVTLQAAADSYGVKIFVLTSFKDTCYIEILPHIEKSKRVICLSFWAEVHYNSIYPEGELHVVEPKKKKWWQF